MGLSGQRTFVGFGFGAIQAGLFLYEAFHSGSFGRLVVAEVVPDVVAAVRRAGGCYAVNMAHLDRVEQADVGPIEIADPAVETDREHLVSAIAQAEEIATAVPGVNFYASPAPSSLHRLLADGLRRKAAQHGPRAVVYVAENHNRAAEILEEHVLSAIPESEREAVHGHVCFANTVIGKMSGVVADRAEAGQRLRPMTPDSRRAFLVEAFNRILISTIRFPPTAGSTPFCRGISVFEEKDDLLPFEEAKLYGHNATHALAAYVAALRGVQRMANLRQMPDMMRFLRAAFIEESGQALRRRWAGVDPLFTPDGYAGYADDLLLRMTNPYLLDTVERVGRDPQRKLGWDDRLIGTLRLAVREGVTPRRYAIGAAAALASLHPTLLSDDGGSIDARWGREGSRLLTALWAGEEGEQTEKEAVLDLVAAGLRRLQAWRAAGYRELEACI